MKNLTWQNPEQLFVAQVLINKVKSKCCGIKANQVDSEIHKAERHVTRIMLDCYKCLNLSLHDEVLLFERPMQVLLWILSAIASGVISIILAKYL